jgi:hypothetical protein
MWSRTYGGNYNDYAKAIISSNDGNFLLLGNTWTYGSGLTDMWLVKVNPQGDTIWSHAYGGSDFDFADAIVAAGDGGFLLAGQTYTFLAGENMFLIKVNSQGELLWSHTFGGFHDEIANAIIPAGDGCFLLAGVSEQETFTGQGKVALIKVGQHGDSLWMRSYDYSGVYEDWANAIIPSGDGGFLLAGGTGFYGFTSLNGLLVKVNSQGDSLWSRTYGGSNHTEINSLIPTSDGCFLLGGWTSVPGTGIVEMHLIKVDFQGDVLWSHTYTGGGSEEINAIVPFGNGFLLAGGGYSNFDTYVQLIKIDNQGNPLWAKSYGDALGNVIDDIIPSGDGNFLLAGWKEFAPAGGMDMWLIKVEGSVGPQLGVAFIPLSPPILIPANGGSFNFNATVQRTQAPQAPFFVWARDRYPDGTYTGNLLGPVQINPPVGVTVARQRTQVVPGLWPAGVHWYIGYAHTSVSYPATDVDSFSWTKSTTGDGGATIWEATNYGEPFPDEEALSHQPSAFS